MNYVVDRSLAGKDDQIKGYTIAVEALGRDASFDPNTQSIVRTEAARLRQELARYYADSGRDDPIRIELPRGRYVPVFRRQSPQPDLPSAAAVVRQDEPSATPTSAWAAWKGSIRLPMVGLVFLAMVTYGLLDVFVLDHLTGARRSTVSTGDQSASIPDRRRRDEPRVAIKPIATIGRPSQAGAIDAAPLRDALVNALSRFEDITVMASAPGRPAIEAAAAAPALADYVLAATLVHGHDGSSTLTVRLTDAPDQAVIWQGSFDATRTGDDQDAVLRRLVVETTSVLLQPFGVIPAAERRKLANGPPSDRQCAYEASELARYFDPDRRERTRTCLTKAITDDPVFAYGHVLLARLYFRDYIFGFASADTLTRALALARRAVELSPTSARAHYTLMNIQVARGFVQEGLAHGEKALALNPYDMRVLMQVGGQLVGAGQVERGHTLLLTARRNTTSNPLPLTWSLFLASYLTDDVATATMCVDQMPGDYAFNHVARALVAERTGDMAGALAAVSVLKAQQSPWIERPRELFSRYIPDRAIVDRIGSAIARIAAAQPASGPSVR